MLRRRQFEAIAETVQGILVLGCLPGGGAAGVGVRYGDVLLEVNGLRTMTVDDYVEARKCRSDGVALRLFRDGQELSVFVPFRPRDAEESWETLVELIAEGRFVGGSESPEPKLPAS
jgi:S1-C subfamily serine protease